MMSRKHLLGVMAVVAAVNLTGCIPHYYTDEYKEKVDVEVSEATDKWFAENMPGVERYTVETFCTESDLYNVSCGNYYMDGEEISYKLNVDTGDFYTSERTEEAYDRMRSILADEMGLPVEDIVLDYEFEYFEIPCLSLRVKNADEDEPTYYSVEKMVGILELKADLTDEEFEAACLDPLVNDHCPLLTYTIYVDSYDTVDDYKDFAIMKKFKNIFHIEFRLRDEENKQNKIMMTSESDYYELRSYWTDKDGNVQDKRIAKKSKWLSF